MESATGISDSDSWDTSKLAFQATEEESKQEQVSQTPELPQLPKPPMQRQASETFPPSTEKTKANDKGVGAGLLNDFAGTNRSVDSGADKLKVANSGDVELHLDDNLSYVSQGYSGTQTPPPNHSDTTEPAKGKVEPAMDGGPSHDGDDEDDDFREITNWSQYVLHSSYVQFHVFLLILGAIVWGIGSAILNHRTAPREDFKISDHPGKKKSLDVQNSG